MSENEPLGVPAARKVAEYLRVARAMREASGEMQVPRVVHAVNARAGTAELHEADLQALLDRVEAGEGWTTVYPCELTRDEPFDFGQCETHDRTFPLGGTCDHAGKSEIDWMSDRESEQRVRAMRAEDRAEAAEAKVAAGLALAADPKNVHRFNVVEEFRAALGGGA